MTSNPADPSPTPSLHYYDIQICRPKRPHAFTFPASPDIQQRAADKLSVSSPLSTLSDWTLPDPMPRRGRRPASTTVKHKWWVESPALEGKSDTSRLLMSDSRTKSVGTVTLAESYDGLEGGAGGSD
ncbi:hypothetical protein FRC12_021149 [Ceratobasidium sp. 428]|nr:hypothetical protein FRC12_021149 [Ceratobasidium sp. 428]